MRLHAEPNQPVRLELLSDRGPQTSEIGEVRFVARQPILDRHERIYGYELLFRAGADAWFMTGDGDEATRSTIDTSLLIGTDSLTDGRRAFINCTRNLLVEELVTVLPRDLSVLEILEDVPADQQVIDACNRLRRAGYLLALDDFEGGDQRHALTDLADIIKVDFRTTTPEQQERLARDYSRRGIAMVAEKIETHDQFKAALDMGYHYFQGYFFCRPVTVVARDLPCLQMNVLRILQTVFEPEYNVVFIERVIKQEPALCYRLLRYLNSAAFGVYPIRSIRHALTMLGQNEIRKWTAIVAAVTLAGRRSSELLVTALARGRFCELLAPEIRENDTDLFLAGMLSLIDAILDQPMSNVLSRLPLSAPCRDALQGGDNRIAQALSLAVACERGDWPVLRELCADLNLKDSTTWEAYSEALVWTRAIKANSDLPM